MQRQLVMARGPCVAVGGARSGGAGRRGCQGGTSPRPAAARLAAASTAAAALRLPAVTAVDRRRRATLVVRADASSAALPGQPPAEEPAAAVPAEQQHHHRRRRRHTSLLWLGGGLAVAAVLGAAHVLLGSGGGAAAAIAAARQHLAGSVLAKSGFFAAFSLIFLSEVGDKTFFIAALLAMRLGKWVSWWGSTISLAAMTAISVGIGYAVKSVPAAVESSEVVGQWLGACLLLYFGVRTLRDAWAQPADTESSGEELEEAEEAVSEAEQGGKISAAQTPLQALLEVASLIFVAEWGDRSMLATIALGAAQSPLGVAGGAILAHGVATLLAVVGGAALSAHISERMVGFIGGALFLVFAAATMLGLF